MSPKLRYLARTITKMKCAPIRVWSSFKVKKFNRNSRGLGNVTPVFARKSYARPLHGIISSLPLSSRYSNSIYTMLPFLVFYSNLYSHVTFEEPCYICTAILLRPYISREFQYLFIFC
jgi:hypothetical protein